MVLDYDSDTGVVNIQHSEQKAPDSVCVLSICIIWEGIFRIMQKWDSNVAMTSPVYLLSTSTLQRTHEVGQMGHGVVGAAH